MIHGDTFPSIDVYYDGATYWIGDGFHRVAAARQALFDTIAATVHTGNRHDALLHALGSNETHGYRRTDADRRYAVLTMLTDQEWQQWSDREIARQCHVSHVWGYWTKLEPFYYKGDRLLHIILNRALPNLALFLLI